MSSANAQINGNYLGLNCLFTTFRKDLCSSLSMSNGPMISCARPFKAFKENGMECNQRVDIYLEWHAGYEHHQHWCVEVMVIRANLEWLRAWEGWLPEKRQYLKNVSQLGCIRCEKGNVKHTLFKKVTKCKNRKLRVAILKKWNIRNNLTPPYWFNEIFFAILRGIFFHAFFMLY